MITELPDIKYPHHDDIMRSLDVYIDNKKMPCEYVTLAYDGSDWVRTRDRHPVTLELLDLIN